MENPSKSDEECRPPFEIPVKEEDAIDLPADDFFDPWGLSTGYLKSEPEYDQDEPNHESATSSVTYTYTSRILVEEEDDHVAEVCEASTVHITSEAGMVSEMHTTAVTCEKPFQCEYCNGLFTHKCDLDIHRRIHTCEEPYKCESCNRSFSSRAYLISHLRSHTGERPYECRSCSKSYTSKGSLTMHMRSHTLGRPKCETCQKSFATESVLKAHRRSLRCLANQASSQK